MTAGTAALILAYNNPEQVRRLIGAIDGLDTFLHCDSRTPASVLSAMTVGTAALGGARWAPALLLTAP